MTGGEWWSERAGMDGTVAIVTGGAGGLGEAITLDLAANGGRGGSIVNVTTIEGHRPSHTVRVH